MTINPVDKSHAGPDEIAEELGDGEEFFCAWTRTQDGEPAGYLIQWRQDPPEWIYADADSQCSLDAMM